MKCYLPNALLAVISCVMQPNGVRYLLVGEMRQRHFDGTSSKPRKRPENAQTPTSRVHALLGCIGATLIDFVCHSAVSIQPNIPIHQPFLTRQLLTEVNPYQAIPDTH